MGSGARETRTGGDLELDWCVRGVKGVQGFGVGQNLATGLLSSFGNFWEVYFIQRVRGDSTLEVARRSWYSKSGCTAA